VCFGSVSMRTPAFLGLALSDSEKAAAVGWIASMDRLWTLLSEDVWGKVFQQNNADEGAIARGLDPFFEEYYNGFMAILQHSPGAGNLEKTLQKCRTAAEGHLETVLREILRNREDKVKAWEHIARQRLSGALPKRAPQALNRVQALSRQFHRAKTPHTQVRCFLELLNVYDRFIGLAQRVPPPPGQVVKGFSQQ
jgi:hypothetical protein